MKPQNVLEEATTCTGRALAWTQRVQPILWWLWLHIVYADNSCHARLAHEVMCIFYFALDWALGVHGSCVPNPVLFVGNRIEREKCSVKANWRAFWKAGVMVVYPIFKLSQYKAHPHFQGRWNVLISRVSGWHFLAFPSCPIVNIWSHYWNSKELK